jgi:membrane protease YdiL (CAAX protease family)
MPRLAWLAIALAIGPFIIKRIVLLGSFDYPCWLAIDYGARFISLIGVVLGFKSGLIRSLESRSGWLGSVLVFLAVLFAALAEQTIVYPVLRAHLDYFRLASIPQITSIAVRTVDLTFGLLLVASSEELVFRRLLFSAFRSKKALHVIVLSALVFALIHLTSGISDLINAFVLGVLLGIAFWYTRRISVCLVAHYLVDLKVFGGF